MGMSVEETRSRNAGTHSIEMAPKRQVSVEVQFVFYTFANSFYHSYFIISSTYVTYLTKVSDEVPVPEL